jgi:hypothetical protein
MTEYSKFNMVYRLQKWMDSVPGQTFLNYAYSWGASVVILGTLFKLTHLPGANLMLYLGMGTEVVVFFLSAFDRPFDKTADGMELAIHNSEESESGETPSISGSGSPQVQGGGTVIIGGGGFVGEEMEEAASNYVAELNRLTEMLSKVSEQSMRLTRDSEEMENLNRTLTGICKVYEMQLKSASSQIGTIDQINEQTKHMAEQIAELNKIYARMIEAMTANIIKN